MEATQNHVITNPITSVPFSYHFSLRKSWSSFQIWKGFWTYGYEFKKKKKKSKTCAEHGHKHMKSRGTENCPCCWGRKAEPMSTCLWKSLLQQPQHEALGTFSYGPRARSGFSGKAPHQGVRAERCHSGRKLCERRWGWPGCNGSIYWVKIRSRSKCNGKWIQRENIRRDSKQL